MSIWEEFADVRSRIPKDAKIYRVDIRYDNILLKHRVYIELVDWTAFNLGWIDMPMGYSNYGFYTTKEKAIEAVKEKTVDYLYPVELCI